MQITSASLQGERQARAGRRAAAAGARQCARRLHRQAREGASTRCRNSRRCATARAPSRTTRSHNLDLYLEAYEAKVLARGGQVHWAETAEDARRHHPRHLPRGRRADRHQGQVDGRRGDRAQRVPRGKRHPAGRDRSRRIHHPAARRASEPHHRARRAPDQGPGRGGFPPRPRRICRRTATSPSRRPARRGAAGAARRYSRGRCRHHRRQFPRRRDRHLDHRHQ